MSNFAGNKGKRGEQEAVKLLNAVIQHVCDSEQWPLGYEDVVKACIQRNKQQSAVGGGDLNGVFGITIEVKRQEQLNVNAWWDQTLKAASRNDELPVLMYKQNHQPWYFYTFGRLYLPGGKQWQRRVRIDEDDFKAWFYQWVYYKMKAGELPKL